jgi:hypothetical protein
MYAFAATLPTVLIEIPNSKAIVFSSCLAQGDRASRTRGRSAAADRTSAIASRACALAAVRAFAFRTFAGVCTGRERALSLLSAKRSTQSPHLRRAPRLDTVANRRRAEPERVPRSSRPSAATPGHTRGPRASHVTTSATARREVEDRSVRRHPELVVVRVVVLARGARDR